MIPNPPPRGKKNSQKRPFPPLLTPKLPPETFSLLLTQWTPNWDDFLHPWYTKTLNWHRFYLPYSLNSHLIPKSPTGDRPFPPPLIPKTSTGNYFPHLWYLWTSHLRPYPRMNSTFSVSVKDGYWMVPESRTCSRTCPTWLIISVLVSRFSGLPDQGLLCTGYCLQWSKVWNVKSSNPSSNIVPNLQTIIKFYRILWSFVLQRKPMLMFF